MQTFRIFLASSVELVEDCRALEIQIGRLNKDWVPRGVHLELELWQDGLDVMAQDSLQHEYERVVCDLRRMVVQMRAPAMPEIRFFFDYESPNAYLAWTQLPKLASRHGFTVEPIPVLYAALLDAHGQLGPGEQPTKGRWMSKNMLRKAALLGVALNAPAFLPFNPLLALRVSILPLESAQRRELINALFEAVWVHRLHVHDAEVVERVANELGLPGAELVAQAQSPEIKSQLRTQTDQAIAAGVFGVPSMMVGEELFWGYDDFPYLELFLAGKDPVDAEVWRQWRLVTAASMRRRFRADQSS